MVFAIVCLTGLVSTQPFKTLIMALIGLGLSTVGMDAITGVYRFTFDSVGLSDGIAFTTIVIGLFSVSEILLLLERTTVGKVVLAQGKRSLFNLKELLSSLATIIRSSFIGFFQEFYLGRGQV